MRGSRGGRDSVTEQRSEDLGTLGIMVPVSQDREF